MKSGAKRSYSLLSTILIVSIILSVIIFIAGWIYISNLSRELSVVRTDSEYLSKEVEALDDLNTKYKGVAISQPLAIDSVPQSKELSSFMADMESLTQKNNLKIKETVIGLAKTKTSDMSLSQMTKKEGYYELQSRFTLQGSYVNFTNFVEQLNALRRVTSISDISILKTTQALAERKDEVKADFVASIYVKK